MYHPHDGRDAVAAAAVGLTQTVPAAAAAVGPTVTIPAAAVAVAAAAGPTRTVTVGVTQTPFAHHAGGGGAPKKEERVCVIM